MVNGSRLLLMAVWSVLAFSGCSGGGRSGTPPDSGTPGTPNPDTAVPDSPEQPVGTANLTVTPPSVDFGAVDLGTTSTQSIVTVTNVGTAMSGPLSVTVSETGIIASGCDGVVLAPKESCQISISVRLTVPGQVSGTIEVGDSAMNTKKIAVSGNLTGGQSRFSLSPNPLDLGKVLWGKTATGTIVLTNATMTALSDTRITVSGAGYSLGLSPTGACTGTLAMQESCNIVVNFIAGTTGLAQGTVVVSQGTLTKTVPVTATVWEAVQWPLKPTSASLQTVPGTPSSPAAFHIICSDVNGAAPTVTITGANKDDFSFTTRCDKPLPGEVTYACQIDVVYNPKAAPATNSTATLTVVEGDSVATAVLTGTTINCEPMAITGKSTDFGTVIVGNTSTELTFTIANYGGSSSGAIEVSTRPSQFVIATDACTGKELAVGTKCTFTVQLTPAAGDRGAIQGQLKATWGTDACSISYLGVSGTAVPPPG